MESIPWLEILRAFPAVKNIYAIKEVAQSIAIALQELVGERVTDVLPAFEGIVFEEQRFEEHQPSESGLVNEAIERFVAARHLIRRTVVVSYCKSIYDTYEKYYSF